ncbi:scavenger receptor cysteine-rich type 1 protein M130-like [Myxocyprinus asiaticus]|uniref:scavenger receptor cysteine-rich type 1 protein M130-like n=1 Tax=Myxocyprinus asiaticus TaxID=70543 RepID=UPI002222A501|nr:scavenger receptor cysteine-rich type 1 protein M130-like [Myxocyprinus asiaticus]
MGCGEVIEAKTGSYFGGSSTAWMDYVNCVGNESTLSTCRSHSPVTGCSQSNLAGVFCHSHIRLVNGINSCSGRVEVLHDGQWGTVCDDGWDLSDAAVVCKEMGCGDVIEAKSGDYYRVGSGLVWMNDVKCDGSESTLMSCTSAGWIKHSCTHNQDVGVSCRMIKVVNGPSRCSGTVQILHDGQWGTVCHDNWDKTDASVVCRELGCSSHVEAKLNAYFGPGEGQTWMNKVQCTGKESSLTSCMFGGWGHYPCGHERDAGITCEEVSVKLQFRIEVKPNPGVDPNSADGKIILEKIKKKLQADGNFTFSWKTQPDGKIFRIKEKIAP